MTRSEIEKWYRDQCDALGKVGTSAEEYLRYRIRSHKEAISVLRKMLPPHQDSDVVSVTVDSEDYEKLSKWCTECSADIDEMLNGAIHLGIDEILNGDQTDEMDFEEGLQ